MKIKVCGMRDKLNVAQVAALGPDYMGFIFYEKSKRFVGENFDESIVLNLPKTIKATGVFVNAENDYILSKIERYGLSAVQLHGNESVEQVGELRKHTSAELIKVYGISDNAKVFTQMQDYLEHVDYFLFDTASKEYGGTGIKFNWSIAENYSFKKPFFLSGGIGSEDLDRVVEVVATCSMLKAVDLNSKFEDTPGLKNVEMLSNFFSALSNSNKITRQ